MSIEILDCLKRERNISVKRLKTIINSQNTAFMWTPALMSETRVVERRLRSIAREIAFASLCYHFGFVQSIQKGFWHRGKT